MLVQIYDTTFSVDWRYTKFIKRAEGIESFISIRTTCIIKKAKEKEPYEFEGSCETSSDDIFCKEAGRKKTLKKVLMSCFPNDKKVRAKVWTAYFLRCPVLPVNNFKMVEKAEARRMIEEIESYDTNIKNCFEFKKLKKYLGI